MKRQIVVPVVVAVAVLGIATTAVALTRGGDGDGGAKPAPSEAADRRTEDAFIGATAAHLCNVQLTVYDDPKALADAYGSTTAYPGISGEQVAALRKRLTTDSEFGARLAKQLATTCHRPRPGSGCGRRRARVRDRHGRHHSRRRVRPRAAGRDPGR
jgi:hypothetical protein